MTEGKHSTHRVGDGMGMVMDGLLLPRCHLMESGWVGGTHKHVGDVGLYLWECTSPDGMEGRNAYG